MERFGINGKTGRPNFTIKRSLLRFNIERTPQKAKAKLHVDWVGSHDMSWVHNSEQGKRATDANVNVSFVACVLSFCLWIGCQSLAHIQNQFNNITIQILCFTYLRTICVYIYIYSIYIHNRNCILGRGVYSSNAGR